MYFTVKKQLRCVRQATCLLTLGVYNSHFSAFYTMTSTMASEYINRIKDQYLSIDDDFLVQ